MVSCCTAGFWAFPVLETPAGPACTAGRTRASVGVRFKARQSSAFGAQRCGPPPAFQAIRSCWRVHRPPARTNCGRAQRCLFSEDISADRATIDLRAACPAACNSIPGGLQAVEVTAASWRACRGHRGVLKSFQRACQNESINGILLLRCWASHLHPSSKLQHALATTFRDRWRGVPWYRVLRRVGLRVDANTGFSIDKPFRDPRLPIAVQDPLLVALARARGEAASRAGVKGRPSWSAYPATKGALSSSAYRSDRQLCYPTSNA